MYVMAHTVQLHRLDAYCPIRAEIRFENFFIVMINNIVLVIINVIMSFYQISFKNSF